MVFYLLRSVHFKSFLKSAKELFLQHKDQRELISSHSYFFRCFSFILKCDFLLLFKMVPRMKKQSVFKCLHYTSAIQEIVCGQAFSGRMTLRRKLEQILRNCTCNLGEMCSKLKFKKKQTFSEKRLCARYYDGATLIQNPLPRWPTWVPLWAPKGGQGGNYISWSAAG